MVARIAHQIRGAIGVTTEHGLRHSTTRIWIWRDEFGSTGQWARAVGELAIAADAEGLWALITDY